MRSAAETASGANANAAESVVSSPTKVSGGGTAKESATPPPPAPAPVQRTTMVLTWRPWEHVFALNKARRTAPAHELQCVLVAVAC